MKAESLKEWFIALLIVVVVLIARDAYLKEHEIKDIHSDYQKTVQTIDSNHQIEKNSLLLVIADRDKYIDSLQTFRIKNNKNTYEKIKLFDTVPIYFIDSFLARNYDSLARFRFGIKETNSR